MEAKQHTLEKPTDHRINQKGNQNVHRNKQKLKQWFSPWMASRLFQGIVIHMPFKIDCRMTG